MTVAQLTFEESRLLAQVAAAVGLMEQKARQLHEAGVFRRYADVHSGYAALAVREGDLEALKRALFLQWYAVSEPACFTGLSDLDPRAEDDVFRLLDELAAGGRLDDELAWMLPYYATVSDWYFEVRAGQALQDHLRSADGSAWERAVAGRVKLADRGQMSVYWLSIRKASADAPRPAG